MCNSTPFCIILQVHVCQDVALNSPGTTTYKTQVLMGVDDVCLLHFNRLQTTHY